MPFSRLVGGALLICLSAAGAAQESPQQTPANAQLFLKEVFGQGSARMSVDEGEGFNHAHSYDQRDRRTNYVTPGNKILKSQSDSDCSTVIEGAALTGYQTDSSEFFFRDEVTYLPIDWSKVAEVKAEGSSVYIRGLRYPYKFILPSEGLGARVAFAMEFLRLHCDKTSATGF